MSRFFKCWWPYGRANSPHELEVTLYTRHGCHLCDDALSILRRSQNRYSIRLAIIDIDLDDDLKHQHGDHVPVIAVGGKIRFRGALNPVLWTRLLRAEARPGRT